ncbi:MAG: iron-sulfur cluster assembly accessory protein [Verrucomicrobia bacterium]|nr:iron-sulfur cluster assembly accessory protein [Verrucomicrobiota bacterium]
MSEVETVEAVVSLTENAATEIKSMRANQPEHSGKALRIYIEQGGCSGRQYGMTFDEQRDGDRVAEFFGERVLVDAVSADYLRGTQVDFVDALTGGGFKISNPNARQSCGCGKSFEA